MPETKQISTILYDEMLPIGEHGQLHLYFDLAETLSKATQYADELKHIRGIPSDLENISPRDAVLMYTTQHYLPQIKAKAMSEGQVMDRVTQYYAKAKQDAERDSILIAMFGHKDNLPVLSEAPKPYPTVEADNDPLIFQMPVISKNLDYPIERRLKRLQDVLVETGAIFLVEETVKNLAVRINIFAQGLVEVDDQGFQSTAANGDIPAEAQPTGVQRKVQKKRTDSGPLSGSDGDTI